MGDGEQLNLDFHVEQTAWGKWVDPERRAAQVGKFMEYAGLPKLPARPWPEGSPEVERIDPLVAALFPDLATAMAPENTDLADMFICFMGECFIKYAGARWFDEEWFGREYSFYDDVNPALLFDNHDEDIRTAWRFMDNMIGYHPGDHNGMFSYFVAALHEYQGYYHDKHREDAST
ncbi:hypothetical protein [Nocardia bovistercoris]|uniref:Uncharacterized protein n=1 Tax=Nocardia bovistercoris TaxID=2785916 RepID=A0A931N1A6_9NOCA|nr:hypothetical protein [Nocardia bovistercoris]MBH0775789.1 hypothetical protein [Nocardia bovistercoris]